VARFAARFGFDIAAETLDLMRHMVADGEADHLVAERVWQEFTRGLMTAHPVRMFDALRSCGALARILPELDALFGVPQPAQHHPEIDTGDHVMRALECAATAGEPLEVRFALVVHDLGKGTTPRDEWPRHIGHESRSLPLIVALCERMRVPVSCKELALAVARWHTHVHRALELRHETILKVLEQCDAFRRAERFDAMLRACECDARGRLGLEDRAYPQIERMRTAARAAAAVDAGAVARQAKDPAQIRDRVHEARLQAIRAALR
jgi:tRNA nucleotidyltransferase (CCA-adding enzyme)